MILSEMSPNEVARRLCGPGLLVNTGPFNFRILSTIHSVSRGLRLLYADYPIVADGEFIDFTCLNGQ